MRPPAEAEIYAPEFPRELDWLNVAFLRMNTLMGRGAVLVEFWDFARINSLRTLPYLKEWHARYADEGLRVIGVHTPGYSFGRDRDTVAGAVERLEIPYAVALDADYVVWREYGNKGWPGRYLFDRTGRLALLHNTSPSGHWLGVDVQPLSPGAVVTLVRRDNSRTVREVQVGSSYLSSEDPRVHFGLGSDSSARELIVRYPDGTVRRIDTPTADRVLTVKR